MCSRGSSQIIKIALVMLISGILLSGKGPKTYQLGLCFFFFTPKRYDKHPYPFPIDFSLPRQQLKTKICPPPPPLVKKKVICPRRPPPLMFRP